MHVTLDDVQEVAPMPTPTDIPAAIPTPTPQQTAIDSQPDLSFSDGSGAPPIVTYRPASGIIWGLIIPLAILVGFVVFRIFQKR